MIRSARSACANTSVAASVFSLNPGKSTSTTHGRPSRLIRCSMAFVVAGKGPTAPRISCANAFRRLDLPALIYQDNAYWTDRLSVGDEIMLSCGS